MFEEQERKLKQLIRDLQKACEDNSTDAQTWKDWANALIRLSGITSDEEFGKTELLDAKSKLKEALKIDPVDLDTKWQLGEVYVYLSQADYNESDDLYEKRCNKALKCFNEVRAVDSDFGKDHSGEFESARRGLEYLRSKPASASKLSAMQDELRKKSLEALEACIETRSDVKTWINWCKVLVRSKGILDDNELDKEMLCEAKKRLKKALENDPSDHEARWNLGEVYMLIVRADSSIFQSRALYKKLCSKAVECFDNVRSVEPEFQRGSTGPLEARRGLD